MNLAFLHDLIGSSTPCRASEAGCPGQNFAGVIILIVLGAAFVILVSSWIWMRWNRGPLPWIMRILGRWPRR